MLGMFCSDFFGGNERVDKSTLFLDDEIVKKDISLC